MTTERIIKDLRKIRKHIVFQCTDSEEDVCSRIEYEGQNGYCSVYYAPEASWRFGDCPMADYHLKTEGKKEEGKIRVGQQKQKKRKK